jgi:hypothetical protein
MDTQINSQNANLATSSSSNPIDIVSSSVGDTDLQLAVEKFTTYADTTAVERVAELNLSAKLDKVSVYPEPTFGDYFSNSWFVGRYSWITTQGKGDLIASLSFPDVLFNIPQLWNRIRGFKYFRGGLKFSFRLNATPFHYGAICASVMPMSHGRLDPSYINYYSLTANPHVIIQPTQHETKELEIGWNVPKMWWDIESYAAGSTTEAELTESAHLFIYVLNQLKTTNDCTNPVSLTVTCTFVDPRYNGINQITSDYVSIPYPTFSWPLFLDTILLHDYLPIVLAKKKKTREVAQIGQFIGGVVSTAEKIAGSVAQVVDVASMAAGAAGFDKPDDVSSENRISASWPSFAHGSGAEISRPMSLDPTNATPRLDTTSQQDSTLINDLIGTPMLITSFDIDLTTDDIPFTYNVSPMNMPYFALEKAMVHTPLSYVASCFRYWRGTIHLDFQVICSSFHSGRIRILWNPSDSFVSSTQQSFPAFINKVYDIATNSIFGIDIPYLNDLPFLVSVQSGGPDILPVNGAVQVTILNPITSMCTTGTVIPLTINVWVSGKDFQFGRPTSRFISTVPISIPGAKRAKEYRRKGEQAQIGSFPTQDDAALTPGLAEFEAHALSGFCFGENITDIIDLCRRFSGPTRYITNDKFYIFFWLRFQTQFQGAGFLRYFMSWFRFVRGSFRVRLPRTVANTGGEPFYFSSLSQSVSQSQPILTTIIPNPAVGDQGLDCIPTTDLALPTVSIPYYTNLLFLPVDVVNVTYNLELPGLTISYANNSTNPIPSTAALYEAAGDDFQLLWRGGPPAVTILDEQFTDFLPITQFIYPIVI